MKKQIILSILAVFLIIANLQGQTPKVYNWTANTANVILSNPNNYQDTTIEATFRMSTSPDTTFQKYTVYYDDAGKAFPRPSDVFTKDQVLRYIRRNLSSITEQIRQMKKEYFALLDQKKYLEDLRDEIDP